MTDRITATVSLGSDPLNFVAAEPGEWWSETRHIHSDIFIGVCPSEALNTYRLCFIASKS